VLNGYSNQNCELLCSSSCRKIVQSFSNSCRNRKTEEAMRRKELLQKLIGDYEKRCRKSCARFCDLSSLLVGGGSHNLRLFAPFPFYDERASGATITDIDGNSYIDFWQGHFANILGHNPRPVLERLRQCFQDGEGLITGFPGVHQGKLARLIVEQVGAERIRFTTSGTLATMYAIMLARAFTKRDLVLKVGGGWHGAQPFALKGISTYDEGFSKLESAGLLPELDRMILVTRFNDAENLESAFDQHGERAACFIIEPFIGSGGFIFASREYLLHARELCSKHGALLIADEVISGFRFHPGALHTLYGITPDLTVFGKIIGGGMPVSAVCGRADVIELCSSDMGPGQGVKFNGGTFSAHPASMIAGCAFIEYLVSHAEEVYPRIGLLGEKARNDIEAIFRTHGFNARCTGFGEPVSKSSIVGIHFLKDSIDRLDSPDQVWNPRVCDVDLRERIFKLEMLREGFHVMHGYGSISSAHTDEEIQSSLDAIERIARRWWKYNISY
jgi:glutamate-1-semialdehyde 2,1-aminomutase